MLTALVLSAAVVTTVDAYNPTTRKSTKTSTKTRTRGGRSARSSKTAAPAAKDVLMPAKEAVTAQKEQDPAAAKEAAKETVNVLTSPDMTKEQAELVAKRAEEAELEKQIKLKNYEKSDIGYGWFGFGSTKEQKASYDAVKLELADLNKNLKDVKVRIRQLEVETGKAWSNAVRYGITALAAVGITAVAYGADRYGFITGEPGGAMKYIGEQGMGAYESAKGSVIGAYEGVKGGAMGLYEKTPDVPYFGSKARAARAMQGE